MDPYELSVKLTRMIEEIESSVVTIATQISYPIPFFFSQEQARSYGSGFIVSEGLVVTNAHVVRNASVIKIMFSDGYISEAEILAIDPSRDLALLRTEKHGVPIKLGDSNMVKPGEIVLAIGSPLGLPGPSVTLGVISAVGRTLSSGEVILEDLIQTDAAINPGNSGGPLVNLNGEAIGVATAIIPYAQGIGFAIPVNTVKRFIEIIRKYGRPLRAWIGVYVAPLNPTTSSIYRLPVKEGLLVVRVVPGMPAYRMGIREGDVIVAANGKPLRKTSELKETIEESIDNGVIQLEIIRGGKLFKTDVPIVVEELD